MQQRLQTFFKFWYRFIVGDDWHLAAGVVLALIVTYALTQVGLNAWVIFPLIVMACLLLSVWQAVVRAHPRPLARPVVLLGHWFKLWGPLVLIALTPIAARYINGLADASATDLVLPVVLNVLAVTIVAGIFFRSFLRDQLTFYLAAVYVTVVVVINYASNSQWAYATFGSLWPLPLSAGLFEPLYIIVTFYLLFRLARWTSRQLTQRHFRPADIMLAVTLTIAAVFAIQAIPAAVDLATAWPQYFYRPPALTTATPTAAQAAIKPNIYYLVLENYDSLQPVPSQPIYAGSGFSQFLTGLGFATASTSYGNYPYTESTVAATLSAGYLSDQISRFSQSQLQTSVPYVNTIRNAPVIARLKALGYSYDLVGYSNGLSSYSPLADHIYSGGDEIIVAGHHIPLDKFADTVMQQNVFWPLFNTNLSLGHFRLLGYSSQANTAATALQYNQSQTPTVPLTGGHFIFRDIPAISNYQDVEAFISQIMAANHGHADIVIQSAQASETVAANSAASALVENQSNMLNWPAANLQAKYGLLTSYYIPGAAPADLAQAGDPVNAFRLLLDTDFNAGLPLLPSCYYGYPQGRNQAFVYGSVNSALTGHTSAACPANGDFTHPGPTKLVTPRAHRSNTGELDDD